jgi:hypothetical protein
VISPLLAYLFIEVTVHENSSPRPTSRGDFNEDKRSLAGLFENLRIGAKQETMRRMIDDVVA